MPKDCYIGLMSGTSMDGIDAVAVDFSDSLPSVVATIQHPYPTSLGARLSTLIAPDSQTSLHTLLEIDHDIATAFADAANALLAHIPDNYVIKAIGSHGQTVYHLPDSYNPNTLQLGDPSLIAERTGITTIADWRRRDMAAGGQGAPLTPAFHYEFLRTKTDVAVLNLGGIANLTIIPGEESSRQPLGFDTGPANTLLDAWTTLHRNTSYDLDGRWAASGNVNDHLLNSMLSDPYFSRLPPKSTGREHFNMGWLNGLLSLEKQSVDAEGVAATLAELTARSIASAINKLDSAYRITSLFVCGGGVHNRHLMMRLADMLSPLPTASSAEAGIDPDQMEAIAFAWFAKKTLALEPIDTTPFTGAKAPRILGGIFHA